jgi:hypothetical protein
MGTYGAGLYGAGPYGSKPLRMSFNPKRNELFIAKGDTTYIFSQFGLSAISARIQDIVHRYDQLLIHSDAVISQNDINLKTNILTLGSLGSKRIVGIEADVICPDDVFISIDYRTDRNAAFTTTPEKSLDKERGFAKFDIKGVEFRVNYRVDNYTSMTLKSSKVKFSFLDRRKRGS